MNTNEINKHNLLIDAIQKKNVTEVKKILKSGIELNRSKIFYKGPKSSAMQLVRIPIIEAVKTKSIPIVKALIEFGADVNSFQKAGCTYDHRIGRGHRNPIQSRSLC